MQDRAWPRIAQGGHLLITAPTGSGKTLAAFLWAIDQLIRESTAVDRVADDGRPTVVGQGTRVLYVSPLKALVYDIERNLRAPLAGIANAAARLGLTPKLPRVGLRTGDTPARERARQLEDPPEILVTTPESLYLLLGSRAARTLTQVDTLIIDELHALAPTKRGAHLALSLERLAAACARDPQRIGLSATLRPLSEAAAYLGGDREVEIVDAAAPPNLDLRVQMPAPQMERLRVPQGSGSILAQLYRQPAEAAAPERGIWSALHPALLAEIAAHRSTILFVNSRGLCERLCHRLNELAVSEAGGEGAIELRAHHGSVSHQQRMQIEEGLKRGDLKAIVATSSLEMGVDMGAVDQVLLIESPGSVARGLQRVGRAGHGVGQTSKARIFPKFRGDLLECAVLGARMLSAELEPFRMPRNALDVLAQQMAAMCAQGDQQVDALHALVRRSGPYRDLSRAALESVLDMLAGRYPSSDFADLKPLLHWDRATNSLSARKGTAMVARLNGGTIPDRGNYGVHLAPEGPRIGELDEEMVYETRAGDCILLGSSTWRVEEITRDRVLVSPAPGEPGKLPFWRGDGPGRPIELGEAMGAFCRELLAQPPERAADWIQRVAPLDALAAANLADYVHEQRAATGQVPSDRLIVVERFRDELGDWRICILTPFGARIHAPWAMALQWQLERRAGFELQVMYTDDGIVLRCADGETLPDLTALLPPVDELRDRVTEQLANTALFAALFRENAARALLMPRRSAKGRQPLWVQRRKAETLLAAVRRYPAFPIVLETYRQALSDHFDLPGLERLLRAIAARQIRVHEVETPSASPFARSLVFAYVAAYIYDQDAPLAERRAQALTLDRGLLAELLGQAELRELLDPAVLQQLEQELQHVVADRRARDAEDLQDLLRRLGDLSAAEAADRVAGDASVLLATLAGQRRAICVPVSGEQRWIAAEDAGLYRDALGVVPPPGLPDAFIAPTEHALEQLVTRYARTHGPFTSRELAWRLGLLPAQLDPLLRLLENLGRLVHGEIRPLGSEPEWCDPDVLRRLRRATLARARDAVAPVDGAALGRFLPAWHGLGETLPASEPLLEAVAQLEGLALPWSLLDRVLLPARLPGYRSEDLDMLAAMGRILWLGRGALGPRDGKVVLYRRETLASAWDQPSGDVDAVLGGFDGSGAAHRLILDHLRTRGASFLTELMPLLDGAGRNAVGQLEAVLWDLVWAGLISNDTFAPLRALRSRRGSEQRGRGSRLAGGRWSWVGDGGACATATERLLAAARALLGRYGVVSREAVQAEAVPGGFSALYPVLKQMEETGRVRRGHFVEGLSGAQFAEPAVVERLRQARLEEPPLDGFTDADARVLATIDPANPYGALLPWPQAAGGPQPKRLAGGYLILVAGKPVLLLAPSGAQLTSFPTSVTETGRECAIACRLLATWRPPGRRRPAIRQIDGMPATTAPLRDALLAAGFVADGETLTSAHF